MYEIYTANSKTEKMLKMYLGLSKDISAKLGRLKLSPRGELDAHPLHGRLTGKWSCWLGYDIRIIYSIDDADKRIIIEAIGSHKIY